MAMMRLSYFIVCEQHSVLFDFVSYSFGIVSLLFEECSLYFEVSL